MAKIPKFTPEEYKAYTELPTWILDSEDFESEADYDAHWAKTVKAFQRSYQDEFGSIIKQWEDAIDYVEAQPSRSMDLLSTDASIAEDDIPFAFTAMMEVIALLYSNQPQPLFVSPSENEDQYAACANQHTEVELKANGFTSQMFDMGVDIGYASLGCFKTYVDYDQVGPYGQEGKIVIRKIDPLKIAFDPKAKRLAWEDLGFIVYEDDLDLGTARLMYKGAVDKIDEHFSTTKQDADKDGLFGDKLVSPVPNPIEGNSKKRNQIKVKECWFKDDRQKFQATMEAVINKEFMLDEDGVETFNPDYDPSQPENWVKPAVDKDGFVIGKMVPAYPHGRCIVTANDEYVVQDFGNPFWHKKAPFAFCRGRPGKKLVTTGDLTNIIKVCRKMNDILSRIHIMCQNEIERPMLAEMGTFKTPRAWMRMSGQATSVLVKNSGKEFGRLPPTEIPQFVLVYYSILEKALDKMMAVAGVMRGQLSEGSQLSQEAVGSLQGMATTMLKMKAEFIAEFVKELAYQVMWLERQTYPQNITTKVEMPDGSTKDVMWHEQDPANDYLVDIQSGSGLPGGHEQQINNVLPLLRNNIIDNEAAAQMLKIRGWKPMIDRMNKKKLAQIEAEATGRALGLQIKKFEKESQTDVSGAVPKI